MERSLNLICDGNIGTLGAFGPGGTAQPRTGQTDCATGNDERALQEEKKATYSTQPRSHHVANPKTLKVIDLAPAPSGEVRRITTQ